VGGQTTGGDVQSTTDRTAMTFDTGVRQLMNLTDTDTYTDRQTDRQTLGRIDLLQDSP